jgi:hypothetical protein
MKHRFTTARSRSLALADAPKSAPMEQRELRSLTIRSFKSGARNHLYRTVVRSLYARSDGRT